VSFQKKVGSNYHMRPRRTGNTFRLLLRALNLASSGKGVAYVAGNSYARDYYISMAMRICEAALDAGCAKFVRHPRRELKFPNGGRIEFRLYEPKAQYYAEVFFDD